MTRIAMGRIENSMNFRSNGPDWPSFDSLVDDLYDLAKGIGRIDAEAIERASSLLALPRYAEIEAPAERHAAALDDIEESVAALPDDYRPHARLLLSLDHPGTNLTHRRDEFEPKKPAYLVTKWKERYTLALVAAELLARAGRSPLLDRGPGYLHERIAYHITVSPDDNAKHLCVAHYDIRVTRDATYLYMVANNDTSDGQYRAAPWKVQLGTDLRDVGTVPFDPTADDGPTMSVVYLGRPYARGEKCRVTLFQEREYEIPPPEYLCNSDTPSRPIELDLAVECPLDWAPSYDRVEHASGALTAPELKRKHVVRDSDDAMTFHIPHTVPPRSYAIRWKM